jgi:predicted Zn-dependent protease
VLVRRGPGLCYFNLLSDGPDRDRRIEAMTAAARSFHNLSDAQVAALEPFRLRVISPAGATAAAIASRMPYRDHQLERLLTLNGVGNPAALTRLAQIKIVQP